MVPEEDDHDGRLQGAQDAHWCAPRRKGLRQSGRHGGPHPGRRDLQRPRAGRNRRRRMGRAARRHETGPPPDRALLLLPGLARARRHDRVQLQQEGLRRAPGRSAADARSCRDGGADRTASRTSTRRTRSRSSGSRRSSRARSRSFRSRRRCCATSRSWRPRSSGRNRRRRSMARKVHASFTKFQALVGPWDHVAEGAYHQLVAGIDRVPGSELVDPDEGGHHRGTTPIRRDGRRRAGGRGGRGRRRCPARHCAAQGPVAAVHDMDPGARRRCRARRNSSPGWWTR